MQSETDKATAVGDELADEAQRILEDLRALTERVYRIYTEAEGRAEVYAAVAYGAVDVAVSAMNSAASAVRVYLR